MNLRDQLLKSGLASKEQAKKAQREVSKLQHQKIQEARAQSSSPTASTTRSAAELALENQREVDRLRNIQINEERLQKEAEARVLDILSRNDLTDPTAKESYYFLVQGKRIARIQVNELQIMHLAGGQLAIASPNDGESFVLISAENAEKIRTTHPQMVVCCHQFAREKETMAT